MRPRSSEAAGEQVSSMSGAAGRTLPHGMRMIRVGVGALLFVLLLSGCEYLPAELRSAKLPFRVSPLKHEVTLQPGPGMGPAPFRVDQAQAGPAEVKLTLSNPAVSAIRVIWAEGTLITADSITYPIGVKAGQDGLSTEPTTIEPNGMLRVTVIALSRDGKPVTSGGKSIGPPYRVGLKLTVETAEKTWKGTLWIFVS